jgi:hypothetical protein
MWSEVKCQQHHVTTQRIVLTLCNECDVVTGKALSDDSTKTDLGTFFFQVLSTTVNLVIMGSGDNCCESYELY